MALEDDFSDIIKKARQGQGLSLGDVAYRCGVPAGELSVLERGGRKPTEPEVQGLASALGLRAGPLADIALKDWLPRPSPLLMMVVTIHGDIGGYAVKGYVLSDEQSKDAIVIDTGYNSRATIETLQRIGLRLTGLCLTHGHADHAGGMDEILQRWPVPVFLGKQDTGMLSWRPPQRLLVSPEDGQPIPVGRFTVRCITTPGHTPGGMCYRVEGGDYDLCFVGDTLFAGSIGRANPPSLYPEHLQSVRRRVLTLPADAVLLPGHGPGTTVGEELAHNPFGAGP